MFLFKSCLCIELWTAIFMFRSGLADIRINSKRISAGLLHNVQTHRCEGEQIFGGGIISFVRQRRNYRTWLDFSLVICKSFCRKHPLSVGSSECEGRISLSGTSVAN
jgi:hypothetical protein